MNKLKNRFFVVLAVGIGAFSMYSCSESFLHEEDTRRLTTAYFDTPEGLRAMAIGLPSAFRLHSSHEYYYAMTMYGTDEFAIGSDAAGTAWNNYDSNLQSKIQGSNNPTHPYELWKMAYVFMGSANIVIAKAPTVLESDPDQNKFIAEARFVRGWLYFFLTSQWGDVPLVLQPVEGLMREFPRAPKAEVLAQVVEDLQFAYDNLTNADKTPGKITKDAAAHFLAKALIYRQSEINEGAYESSKAADLNQALALCNEVITNRSLATNFRDLWDYWGPDGANETNPEIILATQYTADASSAQGSLMNQLNFGFISVYQYWVGMERNLGGGREYARLRTTDYAMDVYDRVNDSRFWKSFRTTQLINAPTDRGSYRGRMTKGQIGVAFIINDKEDASRFQLPKDAPLFRSGSGGAVSHTFMWDGEKYDSLRSGVINLPDDPGPDNVIPSVLPRYRSIHPEYTGTIPPDGNDPEYAFSVQPVGSFWPSLMKYLDGALDAFGTGKSSQRDVIRARVAETYLMAAEVLIRQGKYQEAIDQYINPLRARAEYKPGENRAEHRDGGQAFNGQQAFSGANAEFNSATRGTSFSPVNTYYLSNNMPETTAASNLQVPGSNSLPAVDEAIIQALGYTSEYDRMMCFLLNERSRELMGEQLRWEDLARTKTLRTRAMTFNPDTKGANKISEFHYLRPVPLEYLESVYFEGKPLTTELRSQWQNPGYQ